MKNTGTLQVTTPSAREIQMVRVFDAPRRLVFEAFTKPELVRQWFGPRGYSLVVCDMDVRVGGGWRFVIRGPDGSDMGMRGVIRELTPPDRLSHVETFDDYPGEALITTTFVEQQGKTTVTILCAYDTQQARDAVVQSGMEHGAAESYDRLAEFVEHTSSTHATAVQEIHHAEDYTLPLVQ